MKPFLLSFLLVAAHAAAQPVQFQRALNATSYIKLSDAALTNDGGLVAVGEMGATGSSSNVRNYLVRINSVGSVLWSMSYTDSGNMYLQSVAPTASGAFIATGYKDPLFTPSQATICKVSASGTLLWHRTLAANQGVQALEHGGGYIFTGDNYGRNFYGTYILKTDTNGNTLWSHFYEYGGHLRFNAVKPTKDGGLFFAGRSGIGNTGDIMLMKTDANGNIMWMKRYASAYNDDDGAIDCVPAADGGYVVTGYVYTDHIGNSRSFLMKTDTGGNITWVKRFDIGYSQFSWSVDRCADGGYAVAGFATKNGSIGASGFLMKTNDTGKTQWVKLYGGTAGQVFSTCRQTKDSGYMLAGTSNSFNATNNNGGYLLKTDALGGTGCYESDTTSLDSMLSLQSMPVVLPSDNPGIATELRTVSPIASGTATTLCNTVGLTAVQPAGGLSVLPNPAQAIVHFSLPGQQIRSVLLSDVSGALVARQEYAGASTAWLDIADLPSGIYFYSVSSGGQTYRGKLMVVH